MNDISKFISILFSALFLFVTSGLIAGQAPDGQTGMEHSSDHTKHSADGIPDSQQRDTLPSGVTEDWLNSIIDESGNRIIPEEHETDALQRRTFNGLNLSDRFGYSVSSAGDVNGDGYDDIIAGAYGYNSFTGRAYIFYGGINMNMVADVILNGEATSSQFGFSVSKAGDVNGDGYDDVIVGSYAHNSFTGRAYIYYGGAPMNNTADVTITGEGANNSFGYSVSTAGDVNGDGYSDVIAGAVGYNSGRGRAYIFLGGSVMNNVADVVMTGEASGNQLGISVSSAGDVNGDGYSDALVGADGYNSFTGRAYMFFGGSVMNSVADVIMTGAASGDSFGKAVSAGGDVNGDGYPDAIIGAYGHSSLTGRAYIYFGGGTVDNVADVTFTGEATNTYFANSLSSAGDINGDGYSDIIVGADRHNSFTGKAYIFLGGAVVNNTADITVSGEAVNNFYGVSLSSGDMNGDGYSDIVVGASGYNSNTGRAYLYDYFLRGEIISDINLTGETANNQFGSSVSSAGDVNGDGYSDVIVGASNVNSGTGRAYIFYGGAIMNNVADVVLNGESASNFFGNSVSTAGDVNGDGYSDVIVGAAGYSSFTGRAYIFYGGAAMNNAADVTMTGGASNNQFGRSVCAAGDVNGDGYSDVIAGMPGYNTATGRAFVFFGGSSMNNTADLTLEGSTTSEFGASVSSAGDVNGDGFSDVVVGAPGYSTRTGRAFIFFGGTVMNFYADVVMTGESVSGDFGASTSTAGDVNGDGYSDVVVGAYNLNSLTGRAYIFLGGAYVNNIADVVMNGESASNFFGYSVSSGGDINADGYSDVLVSAVGNNISAGRAYIFLGSSAMDNEPDALMSGDSTNNLFGHSLSSAGDINADGYSDVISSSYNFRNETGRAYIYTGSVISSKPVLMHVKDIPNDQGGKVQLKWARSSWEAYGTGNVTNYLIYRSNPPGTAGFQWVQIGDVSAVNFPFYLFDASTLNDSSSSSNGNTYFLIKAQNSNTGQTLNSNIKFGRSIDNLSPQTVSPFTAVSVSNNVRLNWGKNTAPDLFNYVIYRSTSPSIDPATQPVFAQTTDTTFLDTSPLNGLFYYFIVAQDIHNNISPVAVAESPNITLNLIAFIQGFYNSGSNLQVSDTITVYLRNQTSPYTIADSSKRVVSSNGSASLKFGIAQTGNYYIVVTHRNSIETWSSVSAAMTRGSTVNYDFSNISSKAFGNNMKQVDSSPLRFAIYSGDVSQDGTIDATDLSSIDNSARIFATGYVATDVNGDSFVDGTDYSIADNNATLFVSVIRP